MTKPVTKWLRRHLLVIPHRENEVNIPGPDGDFVTIIIHHAFERVSEGTVVCSPQYPLYDGMRYVRMMKDNEDIPALTHKPVQNDIKEGDIVGFASNQVMEDDQSNRVNFIHTSQEYREIDFSMVFYWRPKGTKEIKVTPGWAIVSMEKEEIEQYGKLFLPNSLKDNVTFKAKVEYVSEGPDGTTEALGVKPGDKVYMNKDMNIAIDIDGETYFMIAHSQILATYE